MASAALSRFNEAVDASNVSAVRKSDFKQVAKRLYIEGAREQLFHLRAHLDALINDPDTPKETQADANRFRALVVGAADRDESWFVAITDALEQGDERELGTRS